MAKTSSIMRNLKRIKKSQKAYKKRIELKKRLKLGSIEEQELVLKKLRHRDESPIRVRQRCQVCGRPRATLRRFGLCRIHFREAAVRGDVTGIRKASW